MMFLVAGFICLLSGRVCAQANDSLLLKQVIAAFRVISKNPDSALGIAQKGLARGQQTGDKRLLANAYKTGGWALMHKGVTGKAMPELLQAAELFRQMHDTLEEAHMYINLGIAYSMQSQFARGATYLLKADSLSRLFKDPIVDAEVQRQMGILYRQQGQYGKAIASFRKSMAMYRAAKDTLYYMDAVSSLCIVYQNMDLPDSSIRLLDENREMIASLQGNDYQQAMVQERYGDAYFALQRYDQALKSYAGAYHIFDRVNYRADMAYESINLGKTYTALHKYQDAQNYLLASYRINDSLKAVNYAHDAAEQLADLYKAMGDWKQAYHWLERKSALQDSLALTDENEKTAQLQAQYENEKKDEEIALLKKDQELNGVIVQRQRAFQYGTILLGLLLGLIGLLAVNRYRAVQRAMRIVDMEKMRNTIARDLHDDMGSTLSSINIISKVALENAEERPRVHEHLRKIHENSGFMLENMSDIVWTIDPVNDTLEQAVFKMKEFAADLLEPLNIQYVFNQTGNIQNVRIGLQTRKNIYLVFKEAINNAVKYSRCTRIDIGIAVLEGRIELQIKDDGRGFARDRVKNGNGLKNMVERARQLGGELSICSEEGRGTTIGLKIKSHH